MSKDILSNIFNRVHEKYCDGVDCQVCKIHDDCTERISGDKYAFVRVYDRTWGNVVRMEDEQ